MGGLPLTSHLRKIVDLVVLFTIFAINHQSDANIYEVAIFTDPNSNGFNHLTVHNVTGDVYIGGVNQLYRLDENLNLIINVTTGPEYDNYGVGHDSNNKILTFNYDYGDLITCGGYLGVCQKRHVQNLTVTYANQNLIYVVANITDDSTVGYVAHHYHFRQPMLYVGTTSTSSNLGYPLVSGRQLKDNIFEVLEDGRGNTRVDINIVFPSTITTFPIRYVAGFSYNGYSYFVTTQKSSIGSTDYISKLVRVCQRAEQRYFNSYTEVTLRCRDDSYNLAQAAYLTRPAKDLSQSLTLHDGEEVLFISFAKGVNNPPTPTTESAICMYKMSAIERAFQDAAKGCMDNDGLPEYTASWMQGASCAGAKSGFQRGVHECHALDYYQYANGAVDQDGYAVKEYQSTLVTSVAVTNVQQHTVGFLGTDTGHVFKIHFVNDTNANTYEEIEFADTAASVLPDMKFDLDNKHFYKTTSASIHKVRVEDCSQYLTCEDCFGSNDPYCGWCTLEKRCSTKANCTRSTGTSRWLHLFDANMCVEIEAIDPENGAPIDVANQITLNMIELPEEDSSNTYLCNYDGLFITSADKYGNNLTCDTPPIESRPKLPPGEDYTTIQLYVRSSETEDFVHTDFHFYDCNVHTSCSSCVSSKWNCNWCVYENRCTHYFGSCPDDDSSSIVLGENNVFNMSDNIGQPFCPQLKMQNGEVLVPAHFYTEIQVYTINIYDNKDRHGYECVMMVEGAPQIVPATRHNETSVTCNAHEYSYTSLVQEMPVRLILKWNGHHIDDIYGYTVKLYNCSINRQDCSECLSNITTRLPLNCGWCKGRKKCEIEAHCDIDWWSFGTHNNCDPPTILQVWPLSGPFEGNTDIIIEGTDLGKQASDIVSVTVANVPCDHLPDRYSVSKKLECKTSASVADYTGNVVVTVIANNGDHREAYHNAQFTFRNPNVLDFTPSLGPKSGGTIVALHGEYIDAGRVIEAFFDGSSCLITRIDDIFNGTIVLCNTTNSNVTKSAALSMFFDGSERLAPLDKKFTFTEDPTVTDINPSASMQSGGRKITVTGAYFTSIKQPTMFITADRTFSSDKPCDIRSFSEMECISPPVDISVPPRKNRNTDAKEATVGFIMDAVEEVRQLRLDFEIVANPEYYPFAEEGHIREHQGEQLVIQGKDLNLASTESEVIVTIGQEECRVVSLSDVQLNCLPPDDEPKGVNKSGSPTENGLPEVIVEVGNLKFFIGYFTHSLTNQIAPLGLIGGLVAVFVLLLVTVVIVIVCCVQKRALNKRVAAVENRMEIVGMEVRTEQGLPFLNYCKYIAKMVYDLHSGNKGPGESLQSNTDQAMDYLENFYSLFTNKSFCLVLIRTLEHQRRMTKDQKKSVGGLLTITLQKEKSMIYLSEILKDLLADAVTKENKTKRENVLTRDYSIAESMLTAWFAITLYSYIKTNIGESIYELFIVMTTNAGTEPRDILRGPAKEKVIRICEEMLTLDEKRQSTFPAPIKYMFDMIDSVAENSDIDDTRYVTERWKCNSLHLGLWAKILQCPEYIFDINPSDDVKRGLEVIAHAFIETCSESMNSVSEIIEFHEEMLSFKTQLQTVIDDIKALPSVSEGALKQYLEDYAQHQSGSSERLLALSELVEFAIGFNDEIAEALLRDEKCKQDGHAAMFKKLMPSMVKNQ